MSSTLWRELTVISLDFAQWGPRAQHYKALSGWTKLIKMGFLGWPNPYDQCSNLNTYLLFEATQCGDKLRTTCFNKPGNETPAANYQKLRERY